MMNSFFSTGRARRAACVTVAALAAWASQSAFADASPHALSFDYDHQDAWHIESGTSQSPIDIRSAEAVSAVHWKDESGRIVVHVTQTDAAVIDNGHTIEVLPQQASATIRGRRFTMLQAHFHAPAEHTIDGARYPVEGHFVFRAQDGRLAVVAVVYRQGDANSQFGQIVSAARRGVQTPLLGLDLTKLLPADTDSYYHYLGSLTTPPLSENVEWYVLTEPMTLSAADIAAFTQRYASNARRTQPLNGRPVIRHSGESAERAAPLDPAAD